MRWDISPFNRRRDHGMEDERNLDSSGGGVDVDEDGDDNDDDVYEL